MNLLPTWPIAAFGLALGLGIGVYADHKVMQGRIDKMTVAHTEELRVREVQRAKDEVAARENERVLTVKAGQIEQEKTDAINRVRSDADGLIARLRNQAASKPANPSRLPATGSDCQVATGPTIPERTGTDLVALAERADQLRAGLSACYQAYDSVAR